MPRYIRENATYTGMSAATVQMQIRAVTVEIRDVSRSAIPQYTAIEAAVWPDG